MSRNQAAAVSPQETTARANASRLTMRLRSRWWRASEPSRSHQGSLREGSNEGNVRDGKRTLLQGSVDPSMVAAVSSDCRA